MLRRQMPRKCVGKSSRCKNANFEVEESTILGLPTVHQCGNIYMCGMFVYSKQYKF